MKRLIILSILLLAGCGVLRNNPALTDRTLKGNLRSYANVCDEEYRKAGVHSDDANIILLTQSAKGDTTVYTLRQTSIGSLLFPPRPIALLKEDSFYVAYRNENIKCIELPVESVIHIIGKEFPKYRKEYKEYLRRKRNPVTFENYPYFAFTWINYEGEYWVLKFVGDTLVSKTIRREI